MNYASKMAVQHTTYDSSFVLFFAPVAATSQAGKNDLSTITRMLSARVLRRGELPSRDEIRCRLRLERPTTKNANRHKRTREIPAIRIPWLVTCINCFNYAHGYLIIRHLSSRYRLDMSFACTHERAL